MKIYGTPSSPHVMRVALAFRAKGHEPELDMPAGGLNSPEFLALNPRGQMPVLVDGDAVVPESAVVARYVDAVLDGPTLYNSDLGERLRDTIIARFVDMDVAPGISLMARWRGREDLVREMRDQVAAGLKAIAHYITGGAPWLTGESFGHGDAALIPFLAMMDVLDDDMGTAALWREQPLITAYWVRAQTVGFVGRTIEEFQAARESDKTPFGSAIAD